MADQATSFQALWKPVPSGPCSVMPSRPSPSSWRARSSLPASIAAQAAGLDEVDDLLLGGRVVAGNQHVERVAVDRADHQRSGEIGVEGLHHPALRQQVGDFLRRALAGRGDEAVIGVVERVGDVDHHLAGEFRGVCRSEVAGGGEGQRQHDDVGGERRLDRRRDDLGPGLARPEILGEVRCLGGSLPATVTALPPATNRVPMPRAMLPAPMMLMFMSIHSW